MTYVALALLGYPVLTWVVWVLYLAIMRIKIVKDDVGLTKPAYYFTLPLLVIGYALDFLLNLVSTLVFLELPKDWLFSGRVSRHVAEEGWRGKLSRWVCRNLLDPFDPSGCHCRGS